MSKGYGHYRNWIYAKYDLLGNVIHETYARLDEVTNDNNLAYVGDWQQNGSYLKNDLVSYEDKTYKVIQDVSGSLVPPSEDEEHYVEFNSDIVSFIPLTSASGTLNATQMGYILASKNTSIVYNDRVYEQVGTTNNSTNFVSFETIDNQNYIYVITVASNGSYTRTSNRIVKEEEVATDLGINEPNNLVYLVRGETKLGNGATFKTINGVSIIGSGNVVVGESGTIAIDDELSTTSENAVQNKVITAELNTKAVLGAFNGGGTGVDYADNANNLIATKGLTVNDDPMSFGVVGGVQKSAVGDGNATLNKLVCVDVVKNQLMKNGNFDGSIINWQIINATASVSNNIATITISEDASNAAGIYQRISNPVAGHKYLRTATVKSNFDGIFRVGQNNDSNPSISLTNGQKTVISYITEYTQGNAAITIYNLEPQNNIGKTFEVSNVFVIDLTQRYGNNEVVNTIIGSDTTTQVAKLLAFDPEILNNTDYDEGTLVPSKTAKLLSVGVNQWDEEWEAGTLDAYGQPVSSPATIRSKNFCECIPNTDYFGFWKAYNTDRYGIRICFYDKNQNFISAGYISGSSITSPSNAEYFKINTNPDALQVTTYNHDICINKSDPTINGKFYPSKQTLVTLPNYEGHGVLKVVDGKVVADGTELYPDGNSKKRYEIVDLSDLNWTYNSTYQVFIGALSTIKKDNNAKVLSTNYATTTNTVASMTDKTIRGYDSSFSSGANVYIKDTSYTDATAFKQALSGVYLVYELATEEDITTPTFSSNFPVEQGGTLQFLDENDNPIAGLQGNEIFYQKNIKAFVEAFGEAINWNPDRIERLAKLSITPEYVNISLNPSQQNAYAVAQVYNATFTIVISTALTGTASGSITFQDSEIDLSSFETQPSESIIDMDGKKASEEPTTPNCNIASFVGRSYNGVVLWSLLHSGVNKVKVHFEQAIPLDSEGNGKLDCRASLIL